MAETIDNASVKIDMPLQDAPPQAVDMTRTQEDVSAEKQMNSIFQQVVKDHPQLAKDGASELASLGVPENGPNYRRTVIEFLKLIEAAPTPMERYEKYMAPLRDLCRKGAELVKIAEREYDLTIKSSNCGLTKKGDEALAEQLALTEEARALANRKLRDIEDAVGKCNQEPGIGPAIFLLM
mmetsp:Transcript_25831/g.31324  ORF Transcript_25831/g.31324 Transcript_25831/m.31324 type:complete len:181 (-) Transcript_25831:145-687(-)|eukprot:CAMPEP_0197845020 /NCGR_PEP_ID=MMETSP1438-20131217/1977_1 /TAXON_ID=1461541 /ORGANISM="Pterosperma sp., Strain CCMP1384" /LENGTH=180 /DNA_ID=CAMNT_0043456087 /DNA_START=241 /DNA_END=783 /DNA_ORIENTATION=-